MKRRFLILALVVVSVCTTAFAATVPTLPPELRKLDVSVGRWVFHGKSLKTAFSKAGTWTWHEDCRWSANRLFLECSFDNVWSGKRILSLVVDTYNVTEKTYWHYEFFAAGASGEHPFVSRMTIDGDTWTESGADEHAGKKIDEHILYHFVSPNRVEVEIEISQDGHNWVTIDQGEGIKQS